MPSHDSHLHRLFISPQALLTKEDNDLWHFKFGYVSYANLRQMFSNSMVTGLPKLKTPRHHIFSSCASGKQHRASFPLEASHRTLELVHADLAGPMEVSTLGGSRYYMLLVDDFSQKSWVCFLSKKSDALLSFQTWLALVEMQAQCKVSTLRSDNGEEFVAFETFLASKGIHNQTTIPYTPQQNGVVERKSCTMKEMARTMLLFPLLFGEKLLLTSVYLLNRSTTKALQGMTPKEAFTGNKPCVSHLCVFGCIAHVHVPSHKRRTFGAKSTRLCYIF